VFGNLDPSSVLSHGTPDTVLAASREAIETAKRLSARFVLCPGCLANADVPPANIQAMTDAAHRWGHY
jgi:uroporphyrinogen-III decarboxylase